MELFMFYKRDIYLRDNCFSKIQLLELIYLIMSLKTCQKLNQNAKQPPLFLFTKPVILLLVGYDL